MTNSIATNSALLLHTIHDIHIHHFKQPQRIQWTVNGRCQQEQCIANREGEVFITGD